RGLDARGNERIAAVDREIAVGARPRGIAEIAARARRSEFRVTGDDLTVDRQVAELVLEVGEDVFPAGVGADLIALDPALHARAAIGGGTAHDLARLRGAGRPGDERRRVTVAIENLIATGGGGEMENAVQRVVRAVEVTHGNIKGIVRRRAGAGCGAIHEPARVIPTVVVNLIAPDRILLALLERYEQMRLVVFAERESGRERCLVMIAVTLIVGASSEVRPKPSEVGIQNEITAPATASVP